MAIHYFKHAAQEPVWSHMVTVTGPGWYHWNERAGFYIGPFSTKEECEESFGVMIGHKGILPWTPKTK